VCGLQASGPGLFRRTGATVSRSIENQPAAKYALTAHTHGTAANGEIFVSDVVIAHEFLESFEFVLLPAPIVEVFIIK
jgi:hypothetical protein